MHSTIVNYDLYGDSTLTFLKDTIRRSNVQQYTTIISFLGCFIETPLCSILPPRQFNHKQIH